MTNCEAMTSPTRSFEYSQGLVKKCFPKKYEILICHNFLISYPIFIIFAPICREIFTLSLKIKVILDWTSPLLTHANSTGLHCNKLLSQPMHAAFVNSAHILFQFCFKISNSQTCLKVKKWLYCFGKPPSCNMNRAKRVQLKFQMKFSVHDYSPRVLGLAFWQNQNVSPTSLLIWLKGIV